MANTANEQFYAEAELKKEAVANEVAYTRTVLQGHIERLLAVESLEYHDKTLLSGDDKTRCEWKQQTLRCCLDIVRRFEL